ncbi:(2Fe-2S)-binding protein [Williamwhitmania taraxaci]|uniref:BFD-like [2Fe-2S] binding domain-containing protein n=1 Tax=Williamwhitmania taraxaci TaxID=1640674 RepID=A0A1G6KYP3_9BACT|nr:(2Fe-2S)-binding protein [Williamwhitmania taraxaci]SDC35486.1 BFD-like [2Fe-2S] binding domain-containing protein [Williamwhitmania taraxaci]
MENDELICSCNDIFRSEIVKAIKSKGLKTIEEVGEATSAGTVCGQCHDDIQLILDELNK